MFLYFFFYLKLDFKYSSLSFVGLSYDRITNLQLIQFLHLLKTHTPHTSKIRCAGRKLMPESESALKLPQNKYFCSCLEKKIIFC